MSVCNCTIQLRISVYCSKEMLIYVLSIHVKVHWDDINKDMFDHLNFNRAWVGSLRHFIHRRAERAESKHFESTNWNKFNSLAFSHLYIGPRNLDEY